MDHSNMQWKWPILPGLHIFILLKSRKYFTHTNYEFEFCLQHFHEIPHYFFQFNITNPVVKLLYISFGWLSFAATHYSLELSSKNVRLKCMWNFCTITYLIYKQTIIVVPRCMYTNRYLYIYILCMFTYSDMF